MLHGEQPPRRAGREFALHRREDAFDPSTVPIEAARKRLPHFGTHPAYASGFLPALRRDHPLGSESLPDVGVVPPAVEFGVGHLWSGRRSALVIVKPEAVIGWHRKGFRLYWTWKSRHGQPGRPALANGTRALIRRMRLANPLWGAPRIHGELLKLGIDVSQASIAKYMARQHKPPSQTWRVFLHNHVEQLVSTDFFVVPTASFRVLFVFVVLAHHRRRVLHFNVTTHPTSEWAVQQIAKAFPWDTAPRYLLHDRDSIYGGPFRQQVQGVGVREVLTPHSRLSKTRMRSD